MRRIVFIFLLAVCAVACLAVPARPGKFVVRMADGSERMAEMAGDEFYHCVVAEDGRLLDEVENGVFEYSAKRIEDVDFQAMRAQGEKKMKMPMREPDEVSKSIVILVGFTDKKFRNSNATFDKMLNGDSGERNNASGSAKEYFSTSSYGKYIPEFDVFGPYELDHDCAYYGANAWGSDANARQMIVDAVAKLVEEKGENVLQPYDCDHDQYVDNIFVFYAGHGENAGGGSDCIWPHRSFVYEGMVEGRIAYGGVLLGDYACTCELQGASGTTKSGIGPFCHEFSHVIGLPDMYDTGYSGHRTLSLWDIMDSGNYLNNEHTPPTYSAYERFYMGWLTPTLLSSPDNCVLRDLNEGEGSAYLISESKSHNLDGEFPDPEEFYLLENRQLQGWDSYLRGHGMLITKIDYDYDKWAWNEVNNYSDEMGVDLIEAGGVRGSYSQASDPFPGTDNVTSYVPYSGQGLSDIVEEYGLVKFRFMGGRNYYKVHFDDMDRGECAVTEIVERSAGAGVTLPMVNNVAAGYEFEGWSLSSSASSVTAGVAGERYYPEDDLTLFAVYSYNDSIVETENGCMVETFNGLVSRTKDVTGKMDKYCDLRGWGGSVLTAFGGSVKCGSNEKKGEMVTPFLKVSGDMTITIAANALISTEMTVSAENGASDSQQIGTEMGVYEFHLSGVPMDSRLMIECDANIFYVDSVEFCGAKKSPVEMVEDDGPVILRYDGVCVVKGLDDGDFARVVDACGRVVCEGREENGEFEFEEKNGFCIVQVWGEKGVRVLK